MRGLAVDGLLVDDDVVGCDVVLALDGEPLSTTESDAVGGIPVNADMKFENTFGLPAEFCVEGVVVVGIPVSCWDAMLASMVGTTGVGACSPDDDGGGNSKDFGCNVAAYLNSQIVHVPDRSIAPNMVPDASKLMSTTEYGGGVGGDVR